MTYDDRLVVFVFVVSLVLVAVFGLNLNPN